MNESNETLVERVVKGFSSIINGLQKENQFTLIPLIKDVIEHIGVEEVRVGDRKLYKKKLATIKMLEKAEGVKTCQLLSKTRSPMAQSTSESTLPSASSTLLTSASLKP
jgi:hypothetical protein